MFIWFARVVLFDFTKIVISCVQKHRKSLFWARKKPLRAPAPEALLLMVFLCHEDTQIKILCSSNIRNAIFAAEKAPAGMWPQILYF